MVTGWSSLVCSLSEVCLFESVCQCECMCLPLYYLQVFPYTMLCIKCQSAFTIETRKLRQDSF